ncbi:hypothetical protein LTR10_004258 [Elasticomyces elasticus]|nr:hypothetical protein LTR10_004258 [Elasticomyces elasticus]KAK4977562.1 hypothetical protein LTR42_001932 [Elasticomyces elasticus]
MADSNDEAEAFFHIVRIVCDDGEIDVNIHALLAASAPLRTLLKPFKDSLRLRSSRVGVEILVVWLTTGEVDTEKYEAGRGADEIVKFLCEAYQLGRRLELPQRFLDEVMDGIINAVVSECRHSNEEVWEIITTIARTVGSGAAGYRFLIDWLVYGNLENDGNDVEWGQKIAELVGEDPILLKRFLSGLFQERLAKNSDLPWDGEWCRYHEHGDILPCYRATMR